MKTANSASAPSPLAYPIVDAVRVSGLSRSYLYEHIKTGELPTVRVGKRRLVLADDLRRWLESFRQKTA